MTEKRIVSLVILLVARLGLISTVATKIKNRSKVRSSHLLYLTLLLVLNASCIEEKATENVVSKPKLIQSLTTDTLKFTSGIRVIFQDSKGNYWFGSHNEGVSFYNGKSFQYFTRNDGLSDNQIRSIQEDRNGKIWFGTAKGITVYDKGILTNYLTSTHQPIADWKKTSGELWFYAGEEDGINRFDGQHINYLVFPKPENEIADNSYGVTGISKDRNGKVWIATYAALFSYDGQKVNRFNAEKLNLKGNELLHIRSVLADSKSRIWIGNNGIGVLLMQANAVINFSEKNNLIDSTSKRRGEKSRPGTLEHVFAIEEDADGNIWFADRDTGAWKYDGKTLTTQSIDQSTKTMILTIYKDKKNNLLFGLADGKVVKFNGEAFETQF